MLWVYSVLSWVDAVCNFSHRSNVTLPAGKLSNLSTANTTFSSHGKSTCCIGTAPLKRLGAFIQRLPKIRGGYGKYNSPDLIGGIPPKSGMKTAQYAGAIAPYGPLERDLVVELLGK